MDSLHGQDSSVADEVDDYGAIEAPPVIGAAERRMHVRAYNYWVSLLGSRSFPSIEDLDPADVEDFGPNSVLLDFSMGIEDPAIIYLGSALREQCDIVGPVERTSQVPPRSLLTRLTDHYLQIIANAAPVGFEAEFTNQRGAEILYRGILMPFSSDDETIDFLYGVISWKEMASQSETSALSSEIAQALAAGVTRDDPTSLAPIWAEGPSSGTELPEVDFPRLRYSDLDDAEDAENDVDESEIPEESLSETAGIIEDDFGFDMAISAAEQIPSAFDELDLSAFELAAVDEAGHRATLPDPADTEQAADPSLPTLAAVESDIATPALSDILDPREADEDLGDALDLARQSAVEARESDARSRAAYYRAIGHAYDFALATRIHPDDYAALLERSGIVVQARAPMTAVAKLVFGTDYDKTRLAEIALALDYALATDMPKGGLARHLAFTAGGLKGLVRDVRDGRKQGEARPARGIVRARRKLCKAVPLTAADLPVDEQGLAVAIMRREADGSLSILGALDTSDKIAQQAMIAASR